METYCVRGGPHRLLPELGWLLLELGELDLLLLEPEGACAPLHGIGGQGGYG
jgi:hypothetical protein